MSQLPIIDAWAQPAMSNVMENLPEVARLFKQSGSAHLLETDLTTEQIQIVDFHFDED